MRKPHVILFAAFSLFLASVASIYPNYLSNPSFESGTSSWGWFWMGDSGPGSAAASNTYSHDGLNSLRVSYQGATDWAFPYGTNVTVTAGEVFKYACWVKTTVNSSRIAFAVATRDPSNNVLSWAHAYLQLTGVFDWQYVENTFTIPPGCASIEFRFTGYSACDVYFDEATLERLSSASPPLDITGQMFTISNGGVTLQYSGDTGKITMKKNAWSSGFVMNGPGSGSLIALTPTASSLSLRLEAGNAVNEVISIDNAGDINLTFSISGAVSGDMPFPGRLESGANDSWVLPQNEGLLIPANDPYYRLSWADKWFYAGHSGFCLPFIGLTDNTKGIIYIIDTPDDAKASFIAPSGPDTSSWQIVWQPSKGVFTYDRSMTIHLEDTGGYVALAKAYRRYAELRGRAVTLAQKRMANPNVDLLIGAADIWWWANAPWWQKDPNCSAAAADIKNAGIEKVLWGQEASGQAVNDMNSLGFLTSRYDIYQDAYDPAWPAPWFVGQTDGWPADLVRDPYGNYVGGWNSWYMGVTYTAGMICSPRGLYWLDVKVPPDLASHNYRARFIDTTTAVQLNECYDPAHPTTRGEDRYYKSRLLERVAGNYGMVTGSETGIDWGVPYVSYFEGMMSIADYRVPNSGSDLTTYIAPDANYLRFQTGPYYRIPLFELVYHDCVVTTWYWGDSSNRIPELWDDKDLYNCLYGTLPLYIMDPVRWAADRDRFVQSFRMTAAVTSKVGYEQMTKHEFMTADRTVQCTEWSDCSKVCVNFGTSSYNMGGIVLAPKGMTMTSCNQPAATSTATPVTSGPLPEPGAPPVIFPNPARDNFKVFLPDDRGAGKVTIMFYSQAFRLVRKAAYDVYPGNVYSMDIDGMASGLYVVRTTLEKDKKVVYSNTQPVVVLR